MRHAAIGMMIGPALALMGCATWTASGVRPDPLPSSVQAPCPHPSRLVVRSGRVSDDKISLGRVGAALIACDAARAIAVEAYGDVRGIVASPQ